MKNNKENIGKSEEEAKPLTERSGSDADEDTGINKGKFAHIGSKQAGKHPTDGEKKGSDADHAN